MAAVTSSMSKGRKVKDKGGSRDNGKGHKAKDKGSKDKGKNRHRRFSHRRFAHRAAVWPLPGSRQMQSAVLNVNARPEKRDMEAMWKRRRHSPNSAEMDGCDSVPLRRSVARAASFCGGSR
jgi:hypothetical protein